MDLDHYTLATGDTRMSPRSEVGDDAIRALAPLLTPGEHEIPGVGAGYSCRVTIDGDALFASAHCGGRMLVAFGVAPTADAADRLWPGMLAAYRPFLAAGFSTPTQPRRVPWCAVIFLGATAEEGFWLADFERCLAWAWVEKMGLTN